MILKFKIIIKVKLIILFVTDFFKQRFNGQKKVNVILEYVLFIMYVFFKIIKDGVKMKYINMI